MDAEASEVSVGVGLTRRFVVYWSVLVEDEGFCVFALLKGETWYEYILSDYCSSYGGRYLFILVTH